MKHGHSVWSRIAFPALSGAALVVAADAGAQTAVVPTVELKEVIVTATRRAEDMQTVAMSVSVLSGDMIENKGVFDLYAIQYAAPSVVIGNMGSANEFNIRGIGRTQVDIDVPSGVVIYRDGAPTIAGYFQTEPYFDIESIEVLRGPQGTFVGKNASGGAVFVNTNDPDLGGFSGVVEGGAGNNNMWDVSGIVNVPLSDTAAVRLSYKHLSSDDFYDSITGDYTGDPASRNLNSYRAALMWEPNDSFTGILKVDYHDLDLGGNVVSSPGFPLYDVEQNGEIVYKDESTRVVADLKFKTASGMTVSSMSAYQKLDSVNNLDVNGSLPVFYQFKSKFTVDIISQEINLISPDDQKVRWVLGAFYFEQNVDVPDWTEDGFTFTGNVFGLGDPIPDVTGNDYPWFTTPWDKHEDEWAVFGQVAADVSPRLELAAGLRYTDYDTSQFTLYTFGFGLAPPTDILPNGEGLATGTQKLSEDSVDYQVALNFDVSETHFLYWLISRGHTSGGINIFPPYRIYDEMEVVNYEFGWKANFQDDQVRTQFSAYLQDFDNYQVNFESPDIVIGQDNRNAPGNSEIWGLEFSMQANVADWHIDTALAYMHSDIGTFEDVIDPFTGELVDLSGRRTPYSPEWTGNIGIARDLHIGDYMLTPRVDLSYVDDTQTKLWDTPLVTLEDRFLVNTRLTLTGPDAKWTATLWGTNVFDKEYVAGIQNLASLYYAGRSREYGVSFRYNF